MTTYRLFPATNGPSSPVSYSGNFLCGVLFKVTSGGMADLLEYLRAEGFPGSGEKLAHFEQCDTDTPVPGLVYGLQLPQGYHAVLAHPDGDRGAISWGLLVPWCRLLHDGAAPAEAWWLEWEDE